MVPNPFSGMPGLSPQKRARSNEKFHGTDTPSFDAGKPKVSLYRPYTDYGFFVSERKAACAAANRAIGTRKGEQET